MDTAKLEKQVNDAGKTTSIVGWLVVAAGILLAILTFRTILVAGLNLLMVGGLGVYMMLAGKRAERQAAARDFPGFRKTLGQLTIAIIVVSVLSLLLGGRPGILLIVLVAWNIRAAKASKKLETGGGAGPAGMAPVSAVAVPAVQPGPKTPPQA
jgi:hypothetical protein